MPKAKVETAPTPELGTGYVKPENTNYGHFKVHPYLEAVFPQLVDHVYVEFVENIREHGQQEPVVLSPDGATIVDGRQRYKACKDCSIKVQYRTLNKTYDTDEKITEYIRSVNLTRRHLTEGQRAFIAIAHEVYYAEIAKQKMREVGRKVGGDNKSARAKAAKAAKVSADQSKVNLPEIDPKPKPGPQARDKVAAQFHIGPSSVQHAKKIAKEAPQLAETVKSGERALDNAYKELQHMKRREGAKDVLLDLEKAALRIIDELDSLFSIPTKKFNTRVSAIIDMRENLTPATRKNLRETFLVLAGRSTGLANKVITPVKEPLSLQSASKRKPALELEAVL